jgi:hypothetical protein
MGVINNRNSCQYPMGYYLPPDPPPAQQPSSDPPPAETKRPTFFMKEKEAVQVVIECVECAACHAFIPLTEAIKANPPVCAECTAKENNAPQAKTAGTTGGSDVDHPV